MRVFTIDHVLYQKQPGRQPAQELGLFARFVTVYRLPQLHVSALREHKGGESMHAVSTHEGWEKLQAEEAAEKAAEV